ncbi:MAG: hypothetical protein Q9183_007039 [Haloplaca sp. 2 TL-2023]
MPPPPGVDLENTGLVPPPPGETRNFDDPPYHSGGIVPLAAVFIPLCALFVFLRVYTKLRIIKVFGLEDWTILVAYACTIFISIDVLGKHMVLLPVHPSIHLTTLQVQQKYGNGIHIWDITLAKQVEYSKWGAASIVVYVPAVGLTKVAILLFYLRLNPEKRFRMIVYAALALTLAYVIALSLTILFSCDPVQGYWDPFIESTCLDQQKLTLSNSILNVIFDFIVLLVPVPMLLKLQVSTRQKLVVGALFSLGSITCIVSAVRIYYQNKVFTGGIDISWNVVIPTSLVFVECNLCIIWTEQQERVQGQD